MILFLLSIYLRIDLQLSFSPTSTFHMQTPTTCKNKQSLFSINREEKMALK